MKRKTRILGSLIVAGFVCAALLVPRARSTLASARAGTAYVAKALCTGVLAAGLDREPGTKWHYASGTSNLISRGLRLAMQDDEAYWRFPYERLFGPLGMYRAILETDPSGTYVGSSFGYATARDWARFGLLYLNDGEWNGEPILPEGWVRYGTTPTPDSEEEYGAHWWLNRGGRLPSLPRDEYQAQGFDMQRVLVVLSRNTVIVRLGQTPGTGFDFDAFGSAVLDALPGVGKAK